MTPLFELVLRHVPAPTIEEGPFRLLGTIMEANPISAASSPAASSPARVKPNQMVKVLDRDGKLVEEGRVTKVLAFRGLERVPLDEAVGGRHRFDRRPAGSHRRAHDLRARSDAAAAGAADRSADPGDDLPRQRLAARRHRRRQGRRAA